jgi:hypothetical protein
MGDEEVRLESEHVGHMLPSGPTLPRGIARGLPQVAERVGVRGAAKPSVYS